MEKIQKIANRLGKSTVETVDQLADVGKMVLDLTDGACPSHVSLVERLQRFVDEPNDFSDTERTRLFAERLKARIDKEVEDCLNYNAEHNVMGTDAIIAVQSTFATVKYYIAELLGENSEDN